MCPSTTGTGIQAVDYSRMKGFEIIPYGNYSQTDTFLVLADAITEPVKQNTVTLELSSLYSTTSTPQNVTISDCIISSITNEELPTSFKLEQNYPNPFNPTTKIKFSISSLSFPNVSIGNPVVLKVYDVMGREVQIFVNESLMPGTYEATFDGSMLPSGVYFYSLEANGFRETKKMSLIK